MDHPEPPVPPREPSDRAPIDRGAGEQVPTADMREQFARPPSGADPEAERAFIESKLNMIRTHPTLSEAEKQAAITELEQKLNRPPGEPEEI
jgi:hypothetical protein